MTRHFLQLYLSIVATLAVVSWGQERLWDAYERQYSQTSPDQALQTALLAVVEDRLQSASGSERSELVADLARRTGVDLELYELQDIAGAQQVAQLARGEPASMRSADGQSWVLRRLADDDQVLVFRHGAVQPQRTALEWALAFVFYAAIALVLMTWLWPLTRDLRKLEQSTMRFGDRNWVFGADVNPRSQVYPLAEAFRRMAARIDGLIQSHRDMSNAMSHEIKTPLTRMRFEVEAARSAPTAERLSTHLSNIDADISELDAFVTATLGYAILERAEIALNLSRHDFEVILPAVVESVRRTARSDLEFQCDVQGGASVFCDAHLMETVVRNLLHNASRYALTTLRVSFRNQCEAGYRLCVDDDGPGISHQDRERVFGSFVRLDQPGAAKSGFGLGLAIVQRVVAWHGGTVAIDRSDLGGARFVVEWPGPGAIPAVAKTR